MAVAGATYLDKLNAVWGSDMTVGEFLRAVDPETLVSTTATMKATKVTWGGPSMTPQPARIAGAGAPQNGRADAPLLSSPVISFEFLNDGVYAVGDMMHYGVATQITSPWHYAVPYMWLKVRLLYGGSTLDQRVVSKYNTWKVETYSAFRMPRLGEYKSIPYHYIEFPAGYDPQTAYYIKVTPAGWYEW